MANYSKYITGSTNGYDIEIWRKEWQGQSVEPKYLAVGGLSMNFVDGDPNTSRLAKTTLDITFADRDFKPYYDQFFTADATKYKVLVKRGVDIVWSGYVTPDSYSYNTGNNVTITARDNIGYLDQLDFDMSGVNTINAILTRAQELISWQAAPWQWVGAYTAENGAVAYGDSEIDCDFVDDKTWGELVVSLLAGYQLRYVGDNTWNIYEITQLATLPAETRTFGYGESSWEVVPSWKTATVRQDYGLKEDLFSFQQDVDDYEYKATPEYTYEDNEFPQDPIEVTVRKTPLYANADLGGAYVANNFNFDETAYGTAPYYNGLMLGLNGLYFNSLSAGFENERIKILRAFGAGSNLSLKIVYNVFYGAFNGDESLQRIYSSVYSPPVGAAVQEDKITVRSLVYFDPVGGGSRLYLWPEGWRTESNMITFDVVTPRVIDDPYGTQELTINIVTMPSIAGTLGVEVSCSYSLWVLGLTDQQITNESHRVFGSADLAGIKSISIEPILNTTKEGQELVGKINEVGNVKESMEVEYGEVPLNAGGIGAFAYGLFKDHESLGSWQRADRQGGVLNLSEHIGRAYAFVSNAFFANGERYGGLILNSPLDFAGHTNIVSEDKVYTPTAYQWDMTINRASFTGREVIPYQFEQVVWDANAVTAGGGAGVSTGNNRILEWQPTQGVAADFEKKRIYELPPNIDSGAGAFIMLDKSGNESAEKLSFDTVRDWINGKATPELVESLSRQSKAEAIASFFGGDVSGADVEAWMAGDNAPLTVDENNVVVASQLFARKLAVLEAFIEDLVVRRVSTSGENEQGLWTSTIVEGGQLTTENAVMNQLYTDEIHAVNEAGTFMPDPAIVLKDGVSVQITTDTSISGGLTGAEASFQTGFGTGALNYVKITNRSAQYYIGGLLAGTITLESKLDGSQTYYEIPTAYTLLTPFLQGKHINLILINPNTSSIPRYVIKPFLDTFIGKTVTVVNLNDNGQVFNVYVNGVADRQEQGEVVGYVYVGATNMVPSQAGKLGGGWMRTFAYDNNF